MFKNQQKNSGPSQRYAPRTITDHDQTEQPEKKSWVKQNFNLPIIVASPHLLLSFLGRLFFMYEKNNKNALLSDWVNTNLQFKNDLKDKLEQLLNDISLDPSSAAHRVFKFVPNRIEGAEPFSIWYNTIRGANDNDLSASTMIIGKSGFYELLEETNYCLNLAQTNLHREQRSESDTGYLERLNLILDSYRKMRDEVVELTKNNHSNVEMQNQNQMQMQIQPQNQNQKKTDNRAPVKKTPTQPTKQSKQPKETENFFEALGSDEEMPASIIIPKTRKVESNDNWASVADSSNKSKSEKSVQSTQSTQPTQPTNSVLVGGETATKKIMTKKTKSKVVEEAQQLTNNFEAKIKEMNRIDVELENTSTSSNRKSQSKPRPQPKQSTQSMQPMPPNNLTDLVRVPRQIDGKIMIVLMTIAEYEKSDWIKISMQLNGRMATVLMTESEFDSIPMAI